MRFVLSLIFLCLLPFLASAKFVDYVTVQGQVSENGKTLASFEYHNNGQIAKAVRENGIENFEWDGLALIERSGTKYINEPHAGGGNPVLAILGDNTNAIFNDVLGTSLGVAKDDGYSAIDKTSFGADSTDKTSFFTGKPYVEDLGYAFLMRNYRSDIGKWLSQDLIGYPDGWNNFMYCNNGIVNAFDLYGSWTVQIGITFTGGFFGAGSFSVGVAFGYSPESGFTAGLWESHGGGWEAGAEASVNGTLSITPEKSVDALSGTAGTIGASMGEFVSIGGEVVIPDGAQGQFGEMGASFSIGFSLGTPAEMHGFVYETFVWQIVKYGGQVNE